MDFASKAATAHLLTGGRLITHGVRRGRRNRLRAVRGEEPLVIGLQTILPAIAATGIVQSADGAGRTETANPGVI
jgi:hypothetical protein